MDVKLIRSEVIDKQSIIKISGSKSETNRLLLLQALYPEIQIENDSNSDDSEVMLKALKQNLLENIEVDIHHAGTAMRFLTAFFAIQEGKEVVLTGSSRMKERPIQVLVDALRQLGADISYELQEGYPPLRIKGKKLNVNKVILPANISSQYISALLLIAPKLESGLEIILEGEITSVPYIKMTLSLLNQIGVETTFIGNDIVVKPFDQLIPNKQIVESDWSSASYWYSIVALSPQGTEITLSSFKKNSLQGDAALVEIYRNFGVQSIFNEDDSITLSKKDSIIDISLLSLDLKSSPDIAQTIAVTCLGLGVNCYLTGLHTLKIKETDRLQALKNEIEKFGSTVFITDESLTLTVANLTDEVVTIATYQDHRMAMAFAPLILKTNLIIKEADVVSKSYPDFWKDLKHVGLEIEEYINV